MLGATRFARILGISKGVSTSSAWNTEPNTFRIAKYDVSDTTELHETVERQFIGTTVVGQSTQDTGEDNEHLARHEPQCLIADHIPEPSFVDQSKGRGVIAGWMLGAGTRVARRGSVH